MSYEPHQQTPLSPHTFDEHSARYRLCCCHVRIWAIVIGILELIALILQLAGGIGNYIAGRGWRGGTYTDSFGLAGMIGGIIGVVIGVVVVSLMLYGVNNIKPKLVIPHLVFQVIAIVLLVISAIGYFVLAGLYGSSRKNQDQKQYEGYVIGGVVGAGFAMLIVAAIEGFFFWVILRAYRYLKDKVHAGQAIGSVPMASSYSSVEKGGRHIS